MRNFVNDKALCFGFQIRIIICGVAKGQLLKHTGAELRMVLKCQIRLIPHKIS